MKKPAIATPSKNIRPYSSGTTRSVRVEYYVIATLLLLSLLFLNEFVYFTKTGEWALHAGVNNFSRWAQPAVNNTVLLVHSMGMLLWIAVVVYQLHSRGRNAHVLVGKIGSILLIASLAFAWRPARMSAVPSLNTFSGLTLIDMTLIINLLGVVIETLAGILKVKDKRMTEHRQHLMAAVLFTAAPGLYRTIFRLLSWLGQIVYGSSLTEMQSLRFHELSACLAIIMGISVLFTSTFGGHRTVLFGKEGKRARPPWHSILAKTMLGLSTSVLILYSVWALHLLWSILAG